MRAPPPRLPASVIAGRYALFATLAGCLNLIFQEIIVRLLPMAPLGVSIVAGTAVGFVVKYALDKRWIYYDLMGSPTAEFGKLVVYGVFGGLTTLLFWSVEWGFWQVAGTAEAKYVGGALGLLVGNGIKYRLDRRFVFAAARGRRP